MKLKKLRNNRNKILKTLSILFKINKIYFVVISISTIISGIIPFFTIKSMQNLINGLQNVTNGDIKLVIKVLIIYVTVNIISILNSSLKGYITGLYKMKVDYVINEKILQKSKSLSLSDYENENVYNMLRKAQDNSSSKIFSIYLTINYVVTQLIVIVSVSTIILSWNPLILLVISIKRSYINY